MSANKSLKFVPRFALHRTRLTPRRLAWTLFGTTTVEVESRHIALPVCQV